MIQGVGSGSNGYYDNTLNTASSTAVRTMNDSQKEAVKAVEKISSGKKVNSAADSASALAILEKMTSQWRGYDVGSSNIQDMRSAMNVADGALSSINDDVSRLQELTLKAANGTMTGDDRQLIQNEIDQIKESIGQTAEYTQFNTQGLIDGTFQNKNVASDPNGKGMSVSIGSASLDALGLTNLDVTGDYDSISAALNTVSQAAGDVSSMRGDIGATSNRLDAQYNVNQNASAMVQESASRMGDADIAQMASQYQQAMLQTQVGAYAAQATAAAAYSSSEAMLDIAV